MEVKSPTVALSRVRVLLKDAVIFSGNEQLLDISMNRLENFINSRIGFVNNDVFQYFVDIQRHRS